MRQEIVKIRVSFVIIIAAMFVACGMYCYEKGKESKSESVKSEVLGLKEEVAALREQNAELRTKEAESKKQGEEVKSESLATMRQNRLLETNLAAMNEQLNKEVPCKSR